MALLSAHIGMVLWPNYALVVDSLGIGPETVLCPSCGMLMWHVMA